MPDARGVGDSAEIQRLRGLLVELYRAAVCPRCGLVQGWGPRDDDDPFVRVWTELHRLGLLTADEAPDRCE